MVEPRFPTPIVVFDRPDMAELDREIAGRAGNTAKPVGFQWQRPGAAGAVRFPVRRGQQRGGRGVS